MDVGRPTDYTQELANNICTQLATSSKSLKTICSQLKIGVSSVYRWLNDNETFREQYARAKEDQADYLAEEMIDIADDGTNDYMTITKGFERYNIEDKEVVNRSKLRVDTRKWIASKLKPKKYADRLDNRIVDEHGNDRSFEITLNIK